MKTLITAALALSLAATTAALAIEDKDNPFLNLNTTQEKAVYSTAVLIGYALECNGELTSQANKMVEMVATSLRQEVKTAMLKTRFLITDIGKANFCKVARESFAPMIRWGD